MAYKVLACDVTGIDEFMRDSKAALSQAESGALAVLSDNVPLFYAVTPERMAQLLALEERAAALPPATDPASAHPAFAPSAFTHPAFTHAPHGNLLPVFSSTPVGKFAMHAHWQPDADFLRMAGLWGVHLTHPVTAAELLAFVSYWQAEGKMFHHVQWQQKLARSVQISRHGAVRRDIAASSLPDEQIPDGFSG